MLEREWTAERIHQVEPPLTCCQHTDLQKGMRAVKCLKWEPIGNEEGVGPGEIRGWSLDPWGWWGEVGFHRKPP